MSDIGVLAESTLSLNPAGEDTFLPLSASHSLRKRTDFGTDFGAALTNS